MEIEWQGARVVWNPAFDLDIEPMDREHRFMVDRLNDLHEAMETGCGRPDIAALFDEVIRVFRIHFEHEEELMALAGEPHRDGHAGLHAKLMARLEVLREACVAGDTATVEAEEVSYVKTWITGHILGVDRGYVDAVKKADLSYPGSHGHLA